MAVYTDNGTNTPNGSHLEFTYTFPTIKTDGTDVKVALNGQTQATNKYTVTTTSPTKITFNNTNVDSTLQESTGAPKTGVTVRVYRDTYVDAAEAVYAAGSSIRAADLNNNQDQVLYALQEEQQLQINSEDIATGAVNSTHILDGTIVNADISANAGIAYSKLDVCPQHKILVGNASETPTPVTMSGDATITSSGAITIADDAVEQAMIADDAVGADQLAANAVVNASVDANAGIAYSKLQVCPQNRILVGNSSEIPTPVAMSGDATIASTGAITIANNAVTSDKIENDTIVNADIKSDAAIAQSKLALDADLTNLSGCQSGASAALAALTQAEVEILDGANVTTAELNYVDGVTSNVQTQLNAKQPLDAELTELATMHTDTASALADLTNTEVAILDGATISTAELNILKDVTADKDDLNQIAGLEKQTTISGIENDKFPTSGAVANYVTTALEPFGGFELAATRTSFPNAQPPVGVVISITDANGIEFDNTETPDSVTGNCKTAGNTNVTIQAAPDALKGKTIGSGVGMLVSSTGSGQNYTFHRLLAKDADVEELSQDIQDFKNRYRVASSAPGSDNDEGDLYFDTGANKMYVYDGSSWGEVTSTGDFKYLVLSAFNTGAGNAPTIDGSISKYDLRENSTSGSLASVTNAAQLMVSVNGVIQKPNTGTSIGSNDGFCMVDGHTIEFGANLPSNSVVFVIQSGSALSINAPGDSTVTEAKLNLSGGSNGEFLKKDDTAAGGFVWGAVPAGVGGATGVTFNDGVHVKLGTHEDGSLYSSGAGVTLQSNAPTSGSSGHLNLIASQDNTVIVTTSTSGGSQTSATFSPGNQYLYTIANIEGTATASGEIRIKETDSGSANYVGLKVPDDGVTSNYTVTLPAAAPTANGQALVATTAGVASWDTVSSTTLDGCGYQNDQTISAGTYEIAANKGVHSVGPITVEGTVTVNGNWVVS